MRRLFRPSAALVIAALLALSTVLVLLYTWPARPTTVPLAVGPGEQEIAWLYPATNVSSWNRFVDAVGRAAERLRQDYPGLEVQAGSAAFPEQSVAVAEVAVRYPGAAGRLLFRWYKLTSDRKARDWLEALLRRDVLPLAVVAGNTSDAAREVAQQLQEATAALPEARRPLLLLTTATASRVQAGPGQRWPAGLDDPGREAPADRVSLMQLYPGRTFRFCFTNRQMAAAVSHFIWTRDDLRPDSDPVYLASWADDSYSRDLVDGFWIAQRELISPAVAGDWAWLTSQLAGAGLPPLAGGVFPVERAGPRGSAFRLAIPPTPQLIDSSVGTFGMPNRFEAQAARFLLLDRAHYPQQQRPLLIVTGQWQPCRRFLRALVRNEPVQGRRFVVATGDAISFNTVYRDRCVTWPIQDLPFPLVFFCHHNPIDPASGFRPVADNGSGAAGESRATGTEDLLLFADIVEALVVASRGGAQPCADAAQLAQRLHELHYRDGRPTLAGEAPLLFTSRGNRSSATGEHVVCLRPHFEGDAVLPEATIEVWAWRHDPDTRALRGPWERVATPLEVRYDDAQAGGPGHE